MKELDAFSPLYEPPPWTEEAREAVSLFVTSPDAPVYSFRSHVLPPQLLGALFSRASRAVDDLRMVFWKEYLSPILHPEEQNEEHVALSKELQEILAFHKAHPNPPYNTKRAFQFFAKWLAQYGDDSIAQMVSTNLVASGLSQPALKIIEDQRIGISPIEKSTRYVDYSKKINGQYRYYTDARLKEWGMEEEYRKIMDGLFETYATGVPTLVADLQKEYPDEKVSVLEKKAFDVLRGFMPMATLSQVAFHGNAQAFKYMIDRCAKHPLGELRWFAREARAALDEEIASLLLRLDDDLTKQYQEELAARRARMRTRSQRVFSFVAKEPAYTKPSVRLVEADPDGETKVIAGLLYDGADSGVSWEIALQTVRQMPKEEKEEIVATHFEGRTARWQKVSRAFENAYVRFEIVMNAGAYRDLHRHRMHTQARQLFTTRLGHETPDELVDYGFGDILNQRMEEADLLFQKIEARDKDIAQYVPSMFHFVRFYQYQNLRQFFWEAELRTGSQGRPDYRLVEQEKFLLLQPVYPLLMKYVLADMNSYDLARRGTEEKIKQKEENLLKKFGSASA